MVVVTKNQACKLKFRLRELMSCFCSAAASAVCFEGRVAGLYAIETGNKLSQTKFEFKGLLITGKLIPDLRNLNFSLWMDQIKIFVSIWANF